MHIDGEMDTRGKVLFNVQALFSRRPALDALTYTTDIMRAYNITAMHISFNFSTIS